MSHQIFKNLLGDDCAASLLSFAIDKEPEFLATSVGSVGIGQLKPAIRKSRRLWDLGPYREQVEQRVLSLVPDLIVNLGLTHFQPTGVETEIVAHEDGAFYGRHIDLFTGDERLSSDRLISLVCYLNTEPKTFSGGELRLYPQILPSAEFPEKNAIDIVPEHGLAVAFSSWLPHEVRPVSCPSTEFRHARFAINCWVLRSYEPAKVPQRPEQD